MTMSLRSLSAAAFMVVAGAASAATVQGVGHSTCSDYVTISRSDSPRLVSNFENWVLGYLSGANMMLTGLNPRNDVLKLVTPAEVPWKQMTKQQRGRYMKQVVTPKMQALFQAHDAKHYTKFGCATCHGKDAKAKGFEMPNPDLPKLPAPATGD